MHFRFPVSLSYMTQLVQIETLRFLQVLALAYYAVSYFPGGSTGMKFLSSALTSSVTKCFGR